jgi:Spy/CpxP family protein refolding chaperone
MPLLPARAIRAPLGPLAAGLVLCLSAAAPAARLLAQPPAGQPPAGAPDGRRGGRMRAPLFEGITLSAAQQGRVDSIRRAYRERMRAEGDERRQSRRALMEERQAALRGVLTADQQRTFDTNTQRMRERMQQRMQGRRQGHGRAADRAPGARR